jgi:hypothetical protein
MTFWHALLNRYAVSPFVLNTIPKSGTNLVRKALRMFPGIRNGRISIRLATAMEYKGQDLSGIVTVPVGVAFPAPVPLSVVEDSVRRIKRGDYASWHVPHAPETAHLLERMRIKMLIMLRDPRDIVISQTHYVLNTPAHNLHAYYLTLSEPERIMASIRGVEAEHAQGYRGTDIDERCRSVLRWTSEPFTCTVTFERLVGPHGGGSRDAQLDELRRLADHLGFHYTPHTLAAIADQLFGGTSTFRKGSIGGWRDHFSDAHKAVFKEIAGPLLVELGYESSEDW